MAKVADPVAQKYRSQLDKTLQGALALRIHQDFPRVGGPRIRALCAEMILEVVHQHLRAREHVGHGQALWLAVAIDAPPSRSRQRIADTELVPVVLDLSTPEDIEARLARRPAAERHLARAQRLCQQAYEQGGLLSNADLSELMSLDAATLGQLLSAHEDRTGKIVPRRATLHDVGTGLTHKRIICRKRYVEGKESQTIAEETWHSLEAVDRYLAQFDRIRHCRQQGLDPDETAYMLQCSKRLVHAYLDIDSEIEDARNTNDPKPPTD